MKLGLSIKIDVTKIDKERIFQGKAGKYIDLTTFIDTETQDKYGNNGFIAQSVTKVEKAAGVKTAILGNVKVFYGGASDKQSQQQEQFPESEDIPF